ncbi:hypothetical protein MA16_Dca026536 [Dendrobium catenatum]|uniref:Transmembrane protein n=1 Tax=Dendrobium catenatum TaxID=906689 RepID=A0A2I0WWV4_9ASPA|nr:hypothetical protein MA16_Dca026536 [Dendrobium catenatum]
MSTLLHLSTTGSLTISEALFFFLLAALMTVGLCSTAALRRKKEFAEGEEKINLPAARFEKEEQGEKWTVGWGGISEVMARVLCWSGRNERLELDEGGVGWRDVEATTATATAAAAAVAAGGVDSGNSVAMSPLWQRRILMGERCQMPMFSGVILYDERGRLLRGNSAKAKQVTILFIIIIIFI